MAGVKDIFIFRLPQVAHKYNFVPCVCEEDAICKRANSWELLDKLIERSGRLLISSHLTAAKIIQQKRCYNATYSCYTLFY